MLPGRPSPSPPTVVGSLNENVYKTPNAVLSSEQALGESQVLTQTQTEVTEESVCVILLSPNPTQVRLEKQQDSCFSGFLCPAPHHVHLDK